MNASFTGSVIPAPARTANRETDPPTFMSARQAAAYLQINEKKVYELVHDGRIPGTKITGKWLFPRDLIDQWLLESSHGGVLADRMLVAGGAEPLLERLAPQLSHEFDSRALLSYCATGTRLGLRLLAAGRVDASVMSWGTAEESHLRHPALLRRFARNPQWILVRLFRRQNGVMFRPGISVQASALSDPAARWMLRAADTTSRHFFSEVLERYSLDEQTPARAAEAASDREAAASLLAGAADFAIGNQPLAREYGLGFLPVAWVAVDLATPRGGYFRTLFQDTVKSVTAARGRALAADLGGYDLTDSGKLIWSG